MFKKSVQAISLRQVYTLLFLVGWFFFPFNDFNGVEALGEYKNEAGAFFFMAGFFVLGIELLITGKIAIPYKSKLFQITLIFIVWC